MANDGEVGSTPTRRFPIIPAEKLPDGVLAWRSPAQRAPVLRAWRAAVFAAFGEKARVVRVAWVLQQLFHSTRGSAFASDRYLAQQTKLPVNKLQEVLTALERGGAILRVHRMID